MPLTCASGARVSISAISAPHPAATTTPVSSSRVAVHGARRRRVRARPNTSSVETNAPQTRPACGHGRDAREHRAQRADGGAAGDAQHVRIGQRIAQQHLHQRAGQREQAADGERRQRARQAQSRARSPPRCRRRPRARARSHAPSTATLPTASASASATTRPPRARGEDGNACGPAGGADRTEGDAGMRGGHGAERLGGSRGERRL